MARDYDVVGNVIQNIRSQVKGTGCCDWREL